MNNKVKALQVRLLDAEAALLAVLDVVKATMANVASIRGDLSGLSADAEVADTVPATVQPPAPAPQPAVVATPAAPAPVKPPAVVPVAPPVAPKPAPAKTINTFTTGGRGKKECPCGLFVGSTVPRCVCGFTFTKGVRAVPKAGTTPKAPAVPKGKGPAASAPVFLPPGTPLPAGVTVIPWDGTARDAKPATGPVAVPAPAVVPLTVPVVPAAPGGLQKAANGCATPPVVVPLTTRYHAPVLPTEADLKRLQLPNDICTLEGAMKARREDLHAYGLLCGLDGNPGPNSIGAVKGVCLADRRAVLLQKLQDANALLV